MLFLPLKKSSIYKLNYNYSFNLILLFKYNILLQTLTLTLPPKLGKTLPLIL